MKISEVLTRVYTNDITHAVCFYEEILMQPCTLQFTYDEANLALAQVGNILILAGPDAALKPFKETKATLIVDSVEEWKSFLIEKNCELIRDIKSVPTGMNLTMKHPEGTIVEYVQYKCK